MADVNLQINPRFFNEVYLKYLYNQPKGKASTMVFYGGAGSGKSVFAVQNTILKALNSKRKILVVRKVGNTLRESIFAEYKSALTAFGIIHLCKIKESYLSIEFPNGSLFVFKGMEDEDKIRSIQGITDIVIEEAVDLGFDEYTQLRLRIRDLKSGNNQVFLMYNPVSKSNWVYPMFHSMDAKHIKGRSKDLTVLHTKYTDNKFLPESYLNELALMKHNNPKRYEIYALGKFASLGKPVYENWKTDNFKLSEIRRDENGNVRTGINFHYSCDFGFTNDPTVILMIASDRANKRLYIFDEVYRHGMLNTDIYDVLVEKGIDKQKVIVDSSEPKSAEELRRLGVTRVKRVKKFNDSVMHGIQFLQGYQIIVHPRCKNTIEEFENYSWKKIKGSQNEYENKPVDEYNHCMDALRYAVEDLMPQGKIRSFKNNFGF